MNSIAYVRSRVIDGFKRGSRELGCPTANVADINHLDMPTGIYCGLAQIKISSSLEIQKVKSVQDDSYNNVIQNLPFTSKVIGWVGSFGFNPYYGNKKKSLEPHLFNEFGYDFYNAEIRLLICKRLRDEANYNSLDELKDAIANDIKNAKKEIGQFEHLSKDTNFFCSPS